MDKKFFILSFLCFIIFFTFPVISQDIIPPTITIISPLSNSFNNSTSIELIFELDEIASWIGYSLDGDTNVTILGNISITSLTEGLHNLTVYANDSENNMGDSGKIFFTIDTTLPTISLISPLNDTWNNTLNHSFIFTPSDNNDVSSCSLWTDETGTFILNTTNSTPITKSMNNVINQSITADGIYLWNIKCVDSSGNSNFAVSNYTLKIDTLPPGKPGSIAATVSFSWISISWSDVLDSGSGRNRYEVYRNNTLAGTTNSTSFNVTGLSSSTWYRFFVRAIDNLENSENSDLHDFQTSSAPPPSSPPSGGGSPSFSPTELRIVNLVTSFNINANSSKSTTFSVSNTLGYDLVNVNVSITGIQSSWYSSDTITRIATDANTTINLRFDIPENAEVRNYTLTVSVTGRQPNTNNVRSATKTMTLNVAAPPVATTNPTSNTTNASGIIPTTSQTPVAPTGFVLSVPPELQNPTVILIIVSVIGGLVYVLRNQIRSFFDFKKEFRYRYKPKKRRKGSTSLFLTFFLILFSHIIPVNVTDVTQTVTGLFLQVSSLFVDLLKKLIVSLLS